MPKWIFVSYRRGDIGVTGRICERLQRRFGKHSVFFDVEAINPGAPFPDDIRAALTECRVFLAIIGPHWAPDSASNGKKLFNEDDWVRIEIELALKRGVQIIPVTIDGTLMPRKDDLPESISRLTIYQESRLLTSDFKHCLKRLIASIEPYLPWPQRFWKYAPLAAVLAASIALALSYYIGAPLVAEFRAARVRSAIASCNVEFTIDCAKNGGISGADEAIAELKSCRNAELYRSDNPLIDWIDVWTTSVYSFAPGGGGPGGGLDDDVLKAGGWGDWYFSLIKFKVPPLRERPRFAAMALYSKTDQLTSVRIEVDQIIKDWSFPKGDRLWWKDRPGARAMTTEPLPPPSQDRWYLIDLTKLMRQWFDGKSPNYGLQIRPASNFGSLVVFVSSDAADKSKIPHLIFCY